MASLGDMLFLLLTFVALMYFVGKFAWGPVTKMMAKRQDKVDNDLDYAENARNEAAVLQKKRQDELKNSQQDAVKIVNTAKENGAKQRETLVQQAQQEVATMKQNATQDIAQQRTDALNAAKNDVANLSLTIAEKLIKKQLNADDQKALIDDYIKGLGDQNGTH